MCGNRAAQRTSRFSRLPRRLRKVSTWATGWLRAFDPLSPRPPAFFPIGAAETCGRGRKPHSSSRSSNPRWRLSSPRQRSRMRWPWSQERPPPEQPRDSGPTEYAALRPAFAPPVLPLDLDCAGCACLRRATGKILHYGGGGSNGGGEIETGPRGSRLEGAASHSSPPPSPRALTDPVDATVAETTMMAAAQSPRKAGKGARRALSVARGVGRQQSGKW